MPNALMMRGGSVVRCLVVAYGTLALLAVVAWALPRMSAALVGAAILLLALPAMAGLWHRGAIRRLERLHQYAPERWLGRWYARRILGQIGGAVVALTLSAAVVLQSPFFGVLEWSLLAASPIVFLALRRFAAARAGPLFSRDVYSASAATRLARVSTAILLLVAWLALRSLLPRDAAAPIGDAVHDLQSAWPEVASATVRWAIDAGAWSQATLGSLDEAGAASWWRVLVALVVLPLTVFAYAAWSASGASLDAASWRRMLGASLTEAADPPRIARGRLVAYGTGMLAIAAVAVVLFAQGDAMLGKQERLLALSALPKCERIGGRAYSLGTLAKLRSYSAVLEERMGSRRGEACARIAEIGRVAERNVDAYLDWYFSLAGDWTRFALLLSGDVESLLEAKFGKLVASDARIGALIGELQLDQLYLVEVASMGRTGMAELLEQQRLVLDERQCRVATDAGAGQGLDALRRYDGLRARMAASAATGVVAGAFAGALTARAMERASMQAARRVLGKAAARRGVGRAASAEAGAMAGAAAGSLVAPGVGTAAGVLAGAAAGLAADYAMLAAEEKLTRADMRRDLLAAVDESLAALRHAFDCPGR
ncbi:MAG: hypothetical protein U1F54_11975 [Burkholderiales bacterium]